jgi:uncharacterized protein YcbX
MITVQDLYIYPVKSLAGIKLNNCQLTPFGLKNDRRWMIVDNKGVFMSQRTTPKMALIKTAIVEGKLVLSYQKSEIIIPVVKENSNLKQVKVWNDTVNAQWISKKVDQWITDILGQRCHLVYMPETAQRQIDLDFANEKQYVSFADAFPLLIISQESLNALNEKLPKPVSIKRFRPNIVVSGCQAFAEDNWREFTINQSQFKAAKRCSRCIMPSINQETGKKDQLKMLAKLKDFRTFQHKIKFGMNVLLNDNKNITEQSISCGDEIILK